MNIFGKFEEFCSEGALFLFLGGEKRVTNEIGDILYFKKDLG